MWGCGGRWCNWITKSRVSLRLKPTRSSGWNQDSQFSDGPLLRGNSVQHSLFKGLVTVLEPTSSARCWTPLSPWQPALTQSWTPTTVQTGCLHEVQLNLPAGLAIGHAIDRIIFTVWLWEGWQRLFSCPRTCPRALKKQKSRTSFTWNSAVSEHQAQDTTRKRLLAL